MNTFSPSPDQAQFMSGYQTPNHMPFRPADVLQPAPLDNPMPETPDLGRQVSAAARDALGWPQISKQAQQVLEVVRIAHRAGIVDLTGRELRAWWQKVHVGGDIDTSTIAARFNELISARRLERLPRRLCIYSQKPAGPVRIVAQQVRLGA